MASKAPVTSAPDGAGLGLWLSGMPRWPCGMGETGLPG